MGKLLSLCGGSSREGADNEDYLYLMVKTPSLLPPAEVARKAFSLSSKVMALSDSESGESIFICDLAPVKEYWRAIARHKRQSYTEVLLEEALSAYGEKSVLLFCHHPFQGYLLISSLAAGMYYSDTSLMQKRFDHLSWEHWFRCAREMNYLFDSNKSAGQINQFEKLVAGLGLNSIAELRQARYGDVQRRFSKFIGQLWRWTYSQAAQGEASRLSFPWRPLGISENAVVKCSLDYPLSEWERIKAELSHSLDRLAKCKEIIAPVRIVQFLWRVTLFDLEACELEITFKFPVDLLKEKAGDYKSILTQFGYAFDSLRAKLGERYADLDFDHVNTALVIGWSIEVTQIILPSFVSRDLFDFMDVDLVRDDDIETLQNRVKGKIDRFRVLDTHIPSLNSELLPAVGDGKKTVSEMATPVIGALNPFYLYPAPVPMEANAIGLKKFIERTSSSWWLTEDIEDSYRDYFICEVEGKLIYAYRDYKNNWYKHGIFS